MRLFRDTDGLEWEVVVGRESWGSVFAIFVPRGRGDPPRQTLLEVTSVDEGLRGILTMGEEELRSLLARSSLKPRE